MDKKIQLVLDENAKALQNISTTDMKKAAALIKNANKIFVLGLGRAGFSIKALGMRLMHMGLDAYAFGETITPDFAADDLLIVASGSGKTKMLVQMAEKAKSLGGNILAITTNDVSPLYKLANFSIIINAPSKVVQNSQFHSHQPMASLYEQGILLVSDALVLTLMAQSKENNDEMFKRHSNLE